MHSTFGIPRGNDGANGANGINGEVSTAQMTSAMDTAIATTAKNPASFAAYTGTFSDPVAQAEMQNFVAYMESFRQWMSR